jgi:hypothetical protein
LGTLKFPLSLQTVYHIIRPEAAIKVAEGRMKGFRIVRICRIINRI